MTDELFPNLPPASRGNRPQRRGYAAPPGTGPAGQTCGSCRHIWRFGRFNKCTLRRGAWTCGYGTDILARAAACCKWEGASNER